MHTFSVGSFLHFYSCTNENTNVVWSELYPTIWWMGRVGNCPPRFWQNRRYRQALTAHCITIFPLSFRKLLTSLIYVWIEPKKCNLVSAYTEEIHANKSSFISKLVPIGKVSTRYFYENRLFAPFPLREIAVQVCRCISWNN